MDVCKAHNESTEAPLISDYVVLYDTVGTAGYAVDCIVAAHYASHISHTHT